MSKKYPNVEKWLSRALNMEKRLEALQNAKQTAYEHACSSTSRPRLDGAAQFNPSQPNDKAAQYVALSEKVDHYIQKLDQIRAEILDVIEQVEDNTLAALLIEYYINGSTWQEVASMLKYDYYHLMSRKKEQAFKAVLPILKAKQESIQKAKQETALKTAI